MAEKEYIEREAAIKVILGQTPEPHYPPWYYGYIKDIPAADVAPGVHAEWIPSPDGINPIKCSRCGTVAPYRMESDFDHAIGLYPYKSNYCPHCGAHMDGGKHG